MSGPLLITPAQAEIFRDLEKRYTGEEKGAELALAILRDQNVEELDADLLDRQIKKCVTKSNFKGVQVTLSAIDLAALKGSERLISFFHEKAPGLFREMNRSLGNYPAHIAALGGRLPLAERMAAGRVLINKQHGEPRHIYHVTHDVEEGLQRDVHIKPLTLFQILLAGFGTKETPYRAGIIALDRFNPGSEDKPELPVVVREIDKLGRGVIASTKIDKGTPIMIYGGEVSLYHFYLNECDADERRTLAVTCPEIEEAKESVEYSFRGIEGKSAIAGMLNDGLPKIGFSSMHVLGLPVTTALLSAAKELKEGEQITWSYGPMHPIRIGSYATTDYAEISELISKTKEVERVLHTYIGTTPRLLLRLLNDPELSIETKLGMQKTIEAGIELSKRIVEQPSQAVLFEMYNRVSTMLILTFAQTSLKRQPKCWELYCKQVHTLLDRIYTQEKFHTNPGAWMASSSIAIQKLSAALYELGTDDERMVARRFAEKVLSVKEVVIDESTGLRRMEITERDIREPEVDGALEIALCIDS